MTPDPRTTAWIELAARSLSSRALVALLRAFHSPEAILSASRAQLAGVVGAELTARFASTDFAAIRDTALAWAGTDGNEIVAWDDPDYPQALLEIADPPPLLFCIGLRVLLNRPSLAIVGSRNASPQGLETARAFARALSGAGLTIVSGLAVGIDGAAHEGALEASGSTLAVVGTGLDRVYPARHRALARAIAERGLLVSEYLPGTPPLPSNFPRRNRLISGLARGVLVVEAALSSGSLVTARCAVEQGRDVFAIPGSIHSPVSKGPHRLIRDGAKLVETAQDILDELRLPGRALAPKLMEPPSPAHAKLLASMGQDPVGIDQLASRSALPPERIAAGLVELELDGRIAAMPGGRWQRLS